jgi:tRNA (guanine-N7-)-methyltransferase
VENPARTAHYHAVIAERRAEITTKLDEILPGPHPTEIVWELGSGHGHFLTAYAQAHPQEHCVGIDLASERVERALRKKNRARLPNLDFFQAEGGLFLDVLPSRLRIRRTFILFPDPWPKARHHKHRIVRADFLSALSAHALPDSRLYFRTDFVPYFESGREVIAGHPAWEIVEEPWPFEFETVFQSRADAHHSLVARRRVIS